MSRLNDLQIPSPFGEQVMKSWLVNLSDLFNCQKTCNDQTNGVASYMLAVFLNNAELNCSVNSNSEIVVMSIKQPLVCSCGRGQMISRSDLKKPTLAENVFQRRYR